MLVEKVPVGKFYFYKSQMPHQKCNLKRHVFVAKPATIVMPTDVRQLHKSSFFQSGKHSIETKNKHLFNLSDQELLEW